MGIHNQLSSIVIPVSVAFMYVDRDNGRVCTHDLPHKPPTMIPVSAAINAAQLGGNGFLPSLRTGSHV
jgi:hypothetical protein